MVPSTLQRPARSSGILALALGVIVWGAGAIPIRAQLSGVRPSAAVGLGSVEGTLLPPPGVRSRLTAIVVSVVETGDRVKVDEHGHYAFKTLPPGTYSLTAAGEGFSRLRITDVVVRPDHTLNLSPEVMPVILKDGEILTMNEVIISAKKDVETMSQYLVSDNKAAAFSDANVDAPRTINDAQAYYIFTNQNIEQSGAVNLEDYLHQRLTMNSTPVENSQLNVAGANYTQRSNSTIALNGLAATQTLILVDGRRLANVIQAGVGSQPDINGIPIDAVDRIEVLPASASGIYGGGALGGVINIVLKQNYTGGDFRVTYETPLDTHAPNRSYTLTQGFTLESGKTHVLVTAMYADADPLQLRDRSFVESYIGQAVANAPSTFQSFAASGTFVGTTPKLWALGGNLSGTASSMTTVPAGYPGYPAGGVAVLRANAGQLALSFPDTMQPLTGQLQQMGAESTVKSVTLDVRRQMTSRLQVFVDASYEDNRGGSLFSSAGTQVDVPAAAPSNPFGQELFITFPTNLVTPQFDNNYTKNLTAGFILDLPAGWKAEGDYTWNESLSTGTYGSVDSNLLANDIAAGKVDVIQDVKPVNLAPYYFSTYQVYPASVDDLALRLSGPVWRPLPAGTPNLSVALENRREGNAGGQIYDISPNAADQSATYYYGESETARSIYAELYVPIFGGKNSLPFVRKFDLQVAARGEDYHVDITKTATTASSESYDFVSGGSPLPTPASTQGGARYRKLSPTLGFTYKPIDDLMLRASYTTAFVPPTYAQLGPPFTALTTTNVADPRRGNRLTAQHSISGGNPNLTPESDRDWAAGVVVTPRFLPGFRFSLDFNRIEKDNDIGTLTAAQVVAHESLFPGRVIRADPSTDPVYGVGAITNVNITALNLYKTVIQTYNAQLDYRQETAQWGTFTLSALATRGVHYQQQLAVGMPVVEEAGYAALSAPLAFTANASLTWEFHRWTLGWTTRYYSAYNEYGPPVSTVLTYVQQLNGTRIPQEVYHDVFALYKMPAAGSGASVWQRLLSRTEVEVGIKDLFNTAPPFDPYFVSDFYHSPYGDSRLRDLFVTVKKSW